MPENANVQQPLETVRSDKFTSMYSNNTNIEVTPWDFKLVFGVLVKPEVAGAPPKIETQVEITMSPQHVKALLGVLTTNVQEYEKQVGEIKLPQPAKSQ